jgi:hypothetical protein
MFADMREKWTTALRSGLYRQATGKLRGLIDDDESDDEGMCCLGVLCDIVDLSAWGRHTGDEWSFDDSDVMPPDWVLEKVELSQQEADILAHLNDSGGWSFERIADAIDRDNLVIEGAIYGFGHK